MQQSSIKLTKSEKKFLLSLMEKGERNDSEIAHGIKISKSSVSRIRKKLTQEGVLAGVTPALDLEKFGASFYAVMLFQWNAFSDAKLTRKMEADFTTTPQVVYFAEGSTPNSKYVAMMAFLDFEDYNRFLSEFRGKYGNCTANLETLFIQQKRVLKQSYGDLIKMLIGGA